MTWTLKNRPKIPAFYSGNDKQVHSEQFDDLCACYKWFEGFEKSLPEKLDRLAEDCHDAIISREGMEKSIRSGWAKTLQPIIWKWAEKEIWGQ